MARENALHEPSVDSPKTVNIVSCIHRFIREITRPFGKFCWAGPFECENDVVAFGVPETPTDGRSFRIQFRDCDIFEPEASGVTDHFGLLVIILVQCGGDLFGSRRPYGVLEDLSWLGNGRVYRGFLRRQGVKECFASGFDRAFYTPGGVFIHKSRTLEKDLGNVEVENTSLGVVRVPRGHWLGEGLAAMLALLRG